MPPPHQVPTQPKTRATKIIPSALSPPGSCKAPPGTPPRRDSGPHHTHTAPSTAENHHGNHARSEHCKAQKTVNPNPRTKSNPKVQSGQAVPDKNAAHATPRHRQDHTTGKGQPPHYDKTKRPRKVHQRHGSKKLRIKSLKQPPSKPDTNPSDHWAHGPDIPT